MRWLTNPVAQFLAAGFVTLVVVVLATSALSRSAADEEAIADARSLTWVLATSVAQPAIPRGLTEGDAAAIDRMDRTALDRLLVDDVLRIKLWDADGTVLYSDRTELIGARYPLGDDELEVLRDGGTDAELSDLGRPENRFERDLGGDLLEVYTRVRSPEGEPLLFEAYLGVDDIRASRPQILDRFLHHHRRPARLRRARHPAGPPAVPAPSRAARERERLLEAAVAPPTPSGCASRATSTTASCRTCPARRSRSRRWRRTRAEPDRRELEDASGPAGEHAVPPVAARRDLPARASHRRPGRRGRRPGRPAGGGRHDGRRRRQRRRRSVPTGGRAALAGRPGVGPQRRAPRPRRPMSLTVRHEADRLVLEVVDDGVGFDPATVATDDHFGLRAAESLVRDTVATWEVESAPGRARWSGWRCRSDDPRGAGRRPRGGPARPDRLIESTDDIEVVGVGRRTAARPSTSSPSTGPTWR